MIPKLLVVVLPMALMLGCQRPAPHHHRDDHPAGHDHHAENHRHGGVDVRRITLWSDRFELFAEHPVAVVGQSVEFLAHLTVLDDFRPLPASVLQLALRGPVSVRATTQAAVRPGIFRMHLDFPAPGRYVGSLSVEGPVRGRIEGIVIYARASKSDRDDHGHPHEHDDSEHAHGDDSEHAHGDDSEHVHDDGSLHAHDGDSAHGHDGDSAHGHDDDSEHGPDDGSAHGPDDGSLHTHDGDSAHGHDDDSGHSDAGLITLLKEQQWSVPFATATATIARLVPAQVVPGQIAAPPEARIRVRAPVRGRYDRFAPGRLVPGGRVVAGQRLGALVPLPESPEAANRVRLRLSEAEGRHAAARAAAERAQRLFESDAISRKALEDADRELRLAAEAERTARRAVHLFAPGRGVGAGASWPLMAPRSGVLIEVSATPGEIVGEDAVLFEILDDAEIWVRADCPEDLAQRVAAEARAYARRAGPSAEKWHALAGDESGRIYAAGRVDPVARTRAIVYRAPPVLRALPLGQRLDVSLPLGGAVSGVVVPEAAVVLEEGRSLVYEQVDGEHFRARLVRLGARQGGRVHIAGGLSAGARVVVKGAPIVRLADQPKNAVPHGHIH